MFLIQLRIYNPSECTRWKYMNRKDMHIKKHFLMKIIIIPMNTKNNDTQKLRSLSAAFFPDAVGRTNPSTLFKIIFQ